MNIELDLGTRVAVAQTQLSNASGLVGESCIGWRRL